MPSKWTVQGRPIGRKSKLTVQGRLIGRKSKWTVKERPIGCKSKWTIQGRPIRCKSKLIWAVQLDERLKKRLFTVILDVQITPFGLGSLYALPSLLPISVIVIIYMTKFL